MGSSLVSFQLISSLYNFQCLTRNYQVTYSINIFTHHQLLPSFMMWRKSMKCSRDFIRKDNNWAINAFFPIKRSKFSIFSPWSLLQDHLEDEFHTIIFVDHLAYYKIKMAQWNHYVCSLLKFLYILYFWQNFYGICSLWSSLS